ncbi:HAMP domain-containing sensor histidine kinase [Streptomyces sp. NPDC088124]|uniref:HAMP domain-containing sensor histidine kinase n=1 Tax=Streptomyces sp. NPDC088124 TaxID=3154654 RepID=UPI003417B5F7
MPRPPHTPPESRPDARRERRAARLPLRRSVLGRLLTVSALVASCSVAATAWLVTQTTSVAIRQEQGQNLSADATIYNTLLGYAATHPSWEGVGATARKLAEESDRRITLTTQDRRPLYDSAVPDAASAPKSGSGSKSGGAAGVDPLPAQASAVVDPLSVDTVLVPDTASAGADRVDPRAVGPFLLPAGERTRLRAAAAENVACLNRMGIAADVAESPSGRPRIQYVGNDTDGEMEVKCRMAMPGTPTSTEQKALDELNRLADDCLKRQGRSGVKLNLDLSWDRGYAEGAATVALPAEAAAVDDASVDEPRTGEAPARSAEQRAVAEKRALARKMDEDKAAAAYGYRGAASEARNSKHDRAVASCVGSARREQLTEYVAAPALLFIDGPPAVSVPGFDLSPTNTARIAGVAALVLALTVGASVIAGTRFVRPLHALTGAAQRMRDGLDSAPVPVGADNEIGRLAAAFNDMAAHRTRLEQQRKAMVSDVAHELRTPLSNIRGWLEAAQDGLAEPDPAFVSSLHDEALQLQHIINDLQDLAAADVGALRLNMEPVRADDLIGQVAAAHQGLAETAGVTLAVSPAAPGAPRPPLLDADPVRLRQAVSNLVSNAVRHTPSGGRVTLRAYVTGAGEGSGSSEGFMNSKDPKGCEGSGGEVAVEVADTGTGIPAADLPHVFDRFWRAEKSRNRSTGGSGLGLAIVLKLAEAHGGTATAVSREGEGSVFTLRLPSGTKASGAAGVSGEAGGTREAGRTGEDRGDTGDR